MLEPYFATDRRVYDGCFCSDMQREADHCQKLAKQLKALDPTASATYFPVEGKYLVFVDWSMDETIHRGMPRQLTGNMHSQKQYALIEAIEYLESL